MGNNPDCIELLKQLALKFTNLKTFKIDVHELKFDSGLVLFWRFLKPIIETNNSNIELKPFDSWNVNQWTELSTTIIQQSFKIDKFYVSVDASHWDLTHTVIQNIIKNLQARLKHLVIYSRETQRDTQLLSIINCISATYDLFNNNSNKNDSFKYLNTIEISNANISDLDIINNLLTMKMIVDKRLFVIVSVNCSVYESTLVEFTKICQNMYELIMNEQIPIDIKFTMEIQENWIFDKCNSDFLRYFDSIKLLERYKQSHCSRIVCMPQAYFRCKNGDNASYKKQYVLHVSNCSKN